MGGSPIVRDTFGSAIYPALSEERGLRELADEELWIAFSESGGFRRPEMCWEFGEYLSQSNRLIKKEGYRRSELFQLFPGEEIVIECETGGEVMPIGVEAKDQASGWYDFPAIGDVRNRGMRTYRYFSDDGDNIMVSCVGEPERVLIYRPKDSLRLNKLYTAMGGVASGTRRQNGGKLLPDGSVSNVAGFGTTHRIRRGMLRMVHYQGYMSQGEGEQRVMILFLGASGEILSGHGVGVSTGGNDSIVEHEAGSQDIWCAVPEQCERMLFCHEFVAGAPRFLVTGF
ncbi:MAG: hypothetical protein K2N03_02200 [Muribaculaceae bacterium]|nr:hypothetical protein [Muribaculaceae bacterium]